MSSRLSDPLRTAVSEAPALKAPEAIVLTSPALARANSLMTVGMKAPRCDRRQCPPRPQSRAENSGCDLPLETSAGHEERRQQGHGAGHLSAAFVIDQQAPVALQTAKGLL